jgi:cyclopropane-fatty-acyl-phospholipid synthase
MVHLRGICGLISEKMRRNFENIHAHYDLSDDFFGLFQDPSRIYSCAYFEPENLTLQEAQLAKVDLHLDKLDLTPGMTVLDVGCGWGATMKRAIERHDVNVIGLTLSRNQYAASVRLLDQVDTNRSRRVLLRGWRSSTNPSTASCPSMRSSISASSATTTSSRAASPSCPTTGG